jgi:amino acid permease
MTLILVVIEIGILIVYGLAEYLFLPAVLSIEERHISELESGEDELGMRAIQEGVRFMKRWTYVLYRTVLLGLALIICSIFFDYYLQLA